jgi:glycerophosphoryl diester phosphodiesterase
MALIVAHRGASAAVPPGNTLEAFAEAVVERADWVELDVHLTADGHVVVHHDPILADGRALGELSAADLPIWIPTLTASLARCHPLAVNVEIKPDGPDALRPLLIERVVELLLSFDGDREFLVTSFDHDIVDAVRAMAPTLPTGLLTFDPTSCAAVLDRAVADGHRAINPWFAIVDRSLVERAHAAGVEVNVWTVDDPDQMRTMIDIGVDAIITNVPRLCRDVISR